MKIGLLGDTHVGIKRFRKQHDMMNYINYLNSKSFLEAIEKLDKLADRTIIAGDLFDSANPSIDALITARQAINNKRISVIAGNHDYSPISDYNGYHAFDVLNESGETLNSDNDITDFKKYYQEIGFEDYGDVRISYLPYRFLNEDGFKVLYENLNKQGKNILIMHGYVDYYHKKEETEYALPITIAENYDLVVSGHVHLASVVKTKKGKVLTPGSLTPSSKADSKTDRPAIWIFDTETMELDKVELENPPKIYDFVIDNGEINNKLEEISLYNNKNNIITIKYNGKVSDIDQGTYLKAYDNSILISIKTNEIMDNEEVIEVDDFWTFIKKSYSEYEEEFRKVLHGY